MKYSIFPPEELIEAEVGIPLSKSVSARALIMGAVSGGRVSTAAVADCDDIRVLTTALKGAPSGRYDVGDSGTALRFLTAYFAAREGADVEICGSQRLCERALAPLVDALRRLGAKIEYLQGEGHAPVRIRGRQLDGGTVSIDGTVSSQFVSALLLIAPLMRTELTLNLEGEAVSESYVRLTMNMMRRAGVECTVLPNGINVSGGMYGECELPAEADWSAASFWYEAVAVTSGFITVKGLTAGSGQPDAAAERIFGQLGVSTDYEEMPGSGMLAGAPDVAPRLNIDLSDNPDMTPALAVTCAMIGVPFRLTGLSTLPGKECDRIAAVAEELAKVGVEAETTKEWIAWDGRRKPIVELPSFRSHGDHRMAMALAFVAAYIPGITIADAEVVSKSYPAFWDELRSCGFTVTDANEAENENDAETED